MQQWNAGRKALPSYICICGMRKAGRRCGSIFLRKPSGVFDRNAMSSSISLHPAAIPLDGMASDETRLLPFRRLKPEMGSFDCGTMNWLNQTVFENSPKFLEQLGQVMTEVGCKPELEVFDVGMVGNAKYYIKKGILKAPCHFQLVMNAAGGMEGSVENLVYLKNQLPEGSTWSATGISRSHMPILLAALALGGHVRVGLEDNVYYAP